MTRIVLEIPNLQDFDLLLPLLRRLGIRIAKTEVETPKPSESEIEKALRIIRQGCDMSSFGDALQYQIETRQERSLPFRD